MTGSRIEVRYNISTTSEQGGASSEVGFSAPDDSESGMVTVLPGQ